MKGIRRIDTLQEIPTGNYHGYYWMSDKESPKMVNGIFEPPTGNNPFIIEAMLWDDDNKKSIMISHTGKYQIFEYNISLLEQEGVLETKFYMPHRLDKVKKVNFKQFWIEDPDPLCEGMPVLKLKAQIFVGFDKEN